MMMNKLKSFFIKKERKIFNNCLDDLPRLDIIDGPWIAGGAAIELYEIGSLKNARDVDIFFKSRSQFDNYYHKARRIEEHHLESKEIFAVNQEYEGFNFTIKFRNNLIINGIGFNYGNTPEDVINTFDFTVTQIATDGICFISNPLTIIDIKNKKLSFVNNKTQENRHPIKKIEERIQKYVNKGFKPDKFMLHWMLENI